jgi:hypothetical protein
MVIVVLAQRGQPPDEAAMFALDKRHQFVSASRSSHSDSLQEEPRLRILLAVLAK